MWHFQGQDGISPGLEHLSAVVFQHQHLNLHSSKPRLKQHMNFAVKDCDGVKKLKKKGFIKCLEMSMHNCFSLD